MSALAREISRLADWSDGGFWLSSISEEHSEPGHRWSSGDRSSAVRTHTLQQDPHRAFVENTGGRELSLDSESGFIVTQFVDRQEA